MFLTVHAVIGAAVGASTESPIVAFILGVLSHAVLDIIPHGDENLVTGATVRERFRKTMVIGVVDTMIMLATLAIVLRPWEVLPSLGMIAGMSGGLLPDGLQVVHHLFPKNLLIARYQRLHDHVHLRIIPYENSFPAGMAIQLGTLIIGILVFRPPA